MIKKGIFCSVVQCHPPFQLYFTSSKCSNNEYEISKSVGLFYLFGAIIAMFYLEKCIVIFKHFGGALIVFPQFEATNWFLSDKKFYKIKVNRKPQGFFTERDPCC